MNGKLQLDVLVVDDEEPARAKVIQLLKDDLRFKVVGEARDGIEALERIEELMPDVVVLDIQMPGINGFEVLDALGQPEHFSVVFSTAFESHALRAFDAHAVDYLLKPYTPERFRRAMDKAHQQRRSAVDDARLVVAAGLPATRTRLTLKTADGPWVTLELARIRSVVAANKHTCIATDSAEHLVRQTLTLVAAQLDARFIQVNRSAVVNTEAIREVHSQTHGDAELLLVDGSTVWLTRTFRKVFFERYKGR